MNKNRALPEYGRTVNQPQEAQGQGVAGGMGLVPKILLVLGAGLVVTTLLFGIDFSNILGFFLTLFKVLVGFGLIIFVMKAFSEMGREDAFSITEDFRTKLVMVAEQMKPPNVHQLWLRGEGTQNRALIGKIKGLAHLPYLVSQIKKDENGHILFLKNEKGEPIFDKNNKKIPMRKEITSEDGDTVFVIDQGFMKPPILVRCHKKYHSDLIGDIYIKDLSLVPSGEYFYPSKQWAEQPIRIMRQSEMEAIMHTYQDNLDLISNTTQMSIASDPLYSKILGLRNEEIARAPTQGMQSPYYMPQQPEMQQRRH